MRVRPMIAAVAVAITTAEDEFVRHARRIGYNDTQALHDIVSSRKSLRQAPRRGDRR